MHVQILQLHFKKCMNSFMSSLQHLVEYVL